MSNIDARAQAEPVRPVPFDPELATALAAVQEFMPTGGLKLGSIPDRRLLAGQAPTPSHEELSLDGTYRVEERQVPGPQGAPDIKLLICRPAEARTPTAAVYHVHGGGMIMGDSRTFLPELLSTVRGMGIAVVSVEYRLAPETPHPGPVEDCYAGLVWTVEHADELGIDPARVVIAGGSAGGGLTAAVALLARDRGGPELTAQMLMSPMLDDRNDSYSAIQMAGLGIWDRAENQVGWTALLGDAVGGPDVSPYGAPARATDLSGLPPTFIDVGAAETFRDEAVTYAGRIWQAGGQAELHVWPGVFHGSLGFAPQARVSQDTFAAYRAWLRRVLAL
ncbi:MULTISPECIES: alpha/beta hydrolase [unclassified Streptomyces]|uniref:alpha/beta hydrolase n=1 Tax=unclassified Streptomyces TaxID=2593676 RepID=UPI0037F7D503